MINLIRIIVGRQIFLQQMQNSKFKMAVSLNQDCKIKMLFKILKFNIKAKEILKKLIQVRLKRMDMRKLKTSTHNFPK